MNPSPRQAVVGSILLAGFLAAPLAWRHGQLENEVQDLRAALTARRSMNRPPAPPVQSATQNAASSLASLPAPDPTLPSAPIAESDRVTALQSVVQAQADITDDALVRLTQWEERERQRKEQERLRNERGSARHLYKLYSSDNLSELGIVTSDDLVLPSVHPRIENAAQIQTAADDLKAVSRLIQAEIERATRASTNP